MDLERDGNLIESGVWFLLATRANRVAGEHVQALNMIDIVFYGSRTFGIHRRSRTEQSVVDAWKEYHDQLNTQFDKESAAIWAAKRDETFLNLLHAISQDVDFAFDRVQLKKGAYSPMAHGDFEAEQNAIRRLTLEVLAGDRPLKMDITKVPFSQEAADAQLRVNQKLADALDGKGTLRVTSSDITGNLPQVPRLSAS